MDLHTRKIIGYLFSKTMDTNLIIAALKNAYEIERPSGSVIFHSDLGTQYTSEAYRYQLKKYNMIALYSNKGCLMIMHVLSLFNLFKRKKK